MGGRHSTEVAFGLHTQPSWVQFLAFPKFFSVIIFLEKIKLSMLPRLINGAAA